MVVDDEEDDLEDDLEELFEALYDLEKREGDLDPTSADLRLDDLSNLSDNPLPI